MSEATPRLALPLIAAAQAQKHIPHNEALVALDAIVHLALIDRAAIPPSSPNEGERFLVGASPSGAYAGHANAIAVMDNGAWRFFQPREGWTAWIVSEAVMLVFADGAWGDLKPRSADRFGVATEADSANRLAVASDAVLLTHDGADCQLKINKAAPTDTASLLFQTAHAGHAEMGLAGDDKFHIKVSADGVSWSNAWVLDPANAFVGFGTSVPAARLELQGSTTAQAQIKARTEASGTNFGGGLVLHHNNADGSLPLAGDRLGYVLFGTTIAGVGYQGAGILARAEGDFSSSSLPSYFTFETAPAGAARVERLRITSDGRVGIATSSPNCALDVAGPVRVGRYTLATLPGAGPSGTGAMIYVSDESSGAVLAFSDGVSWRRVTDRAVVS